VEHRTEAVKPLGVYGPTAWCTDWRLRTNRVAKKKPRADHGQVNPPELDFMRPLGQPRLMLVRRLQISAASGAKSTASQLQVTRASAATAVVLGCNEGQALASDHTESGR
jgi:hypothetical protein